LFDRANCQKIDVLVLATLQFRAQHPPTSDPDGSNVNFAGLTLVGLRTRFFPGRVISLVGPQ